MAAQEATACRAKAMTLAAAVAVAVAPVRQAPTAQTD
jgi:hypothetical protein